MFKHLIITLLLAGLVICRALGATDNADDPAYSDGWNDNSNPPADNGGSGFQPWTTLENTGNGSKFITNTRQVDGLASFAILAGNLSDTGFAEGRALSAPITAGTYELTARFDVDNSTQFSGFNLKSAAGSQFGSDSFELIAFGLAPFDGNNAIAVFGASNSTIDLGHDLRGDIIQFSLGFDTSGTGSFTLTATDLTSFATGSVSGELKFGGAPVDLLGFGNFNFGIDQSLIFDSVHIEIVPEPSAWVMTCIGGCYLAVCFFKRMSGRGACDNPSPNEHNRDHEAVEP